MGPKILRIERLKRKFSLEVERELGDHKETAAQIETPAKSSAPPDLTSYPLARTDTLQG